MVKRIIIAAIAVLTAVAVEGLAFQPVVCEKLDENSLQQNGGTFDKIEDLFYTIFGEIEDPECHR